MADKIRKFQVDTTEIALKEDIAAALPIGTSIMWTGDAVDVPEGFFIENGQAISRTTHAEYFALVGTNYGVGDGSTTFNIDDKRGLEVVGVGSRSLNGRTKTGPSDPYTKQEDQFQGWQAGCDQSADAVAGPYYSGVSNDGNTTTGTLLANRVYPTYDKSFQGIAHMIRAQNDGTNGTPRTGTETRTSRAGVYFIVRA